MWTLHQLQQRLESSISADSQHVHDEGPATAGQGMKSNLAALPSHEAVVDDASILADREINVTEPPWGFSEEELTRFPALKRRNFWCIQRHQARALHYDLRMQLDGATVSWAVPKGLLGISRTGEANRMAVETTLHPISYTVYEGADGRVLPSGQWAGTLLWDIGYYEIGYHDEVDSDQDSPPQKRRKLNATASGRLKESPDDPTGRHEENKFREAFNKAPTAKKPRSIHFTLKGGRKMTNHSYILILPTANRISQTMLRDGREKKTWFISLPRGIQGYPWGKGGEEGEESGRSVKSGLTLREVCRQRPVGKRMWQAELAAFAGWSDRVDELKGLT